MIFIEFSRIKRSWCKITFLNHFIYVGHSMWNQPTLPTLPTWILLIFCQCTHQEMKVLKISSSYHERFQNYDHLNYEPSSLDNKILQFMTFWNCSYSASFNSKHLKFWMRTHFLEVFTTKNLFSEYWSSGGVLKLSNWPLQYFFHIFSGL